MIPYKYNSRELKMGYFQKCHFTKILYFNQTFRSTYCCTDCTTLLDVSFRFLKKLPAPPLIVENRPPPVLGAAEGGTAGGGLKQLKM